MSTKMTIFIILLILIGLFVIQNTETVQIRFLFWQLEASRIFIYLVLFLLGAATGWLGNTFRRWHRDR